MNKKLQIAFGISIALAIFAILNFTTHSGVENWDGTQSNMIIENKEQILKILDSCEEKRMSEELFMKYGTISKLTDEKILFANETHYIDNIDCQWGTTIEFQLLQVLDYCNDKSENKISIQYSNQTHYIDTASCQWIKLTGFSETPKIIEENYEDDFETDYETDYTEKFD